MKIILTEDQNQALNYSKLSICVKRRMILDELDNIVVDAMEDYVTFRDSIENFIDEVINYAYDKLDAEYGIEKCWGDETWYRFSIPIKRFLVSRYESSLKKYFEDYYN
jgi:transposase